MKSVLRQIVEREAKKLSKLSEGEEPLDGGQLERLELLAKCARHLASDDEDDAPPGSPGADDAKLVGA